MGLYPFFLPRGIIKNGLVAWYDFSKRNLLRWSGAFNNAVWQKGAAVSFVDDNATAPDGSLTASTATVIAGGGNLFFQIVPVVAGRTYTFYWWAKKGTISTLKYSVYNETAGSEFIASTEYAATIDWKQEPFSITFTAPVGCSAVRVYPLRDTGATGTAFFWHPQLNEGSYPLTYEATTDNQLLLDRSPNGYNGQLGSVAGADTNDPTWTGQGLSFGGDDLVTLPNTPAITSLDTVFYTGAAINAASAASQLLMRVSVSGVYFGSLTGLLTNEIITIRADIGDDGGANEMCIGWCHATDSIAVGWHLLQLDFTGASWRLLLDGSEKTLTVVGTPRVIPAGIGTFGGRATVFLNNAQMAPTIEYSRSRTDAELARNRNVLRTEMYRRGATPLW